MNATAAKTPQEAVKAILAIQDLFHVTVNGMTVSTERAHELLRGIYDIAHSAQKPDAAPQMLAALQKAFPGSSYARPP